MEAALAFFTGLLLLLLGLQGNSSPAAVAADPFFDKLALLDFIFNVQPRRLLNWNFLAPVCGNWVGVTCSADESRVVALRLPGFGLTGPIPNNTLGRLTALHTLSLRCNSLTGPFPADLATLASLAHLHLQSNALSGPLPADFSVWRNLTVLDLSFNSFNGSIPSSISNLTQLAALDLSNNSLSGGIPPDLQLPSLELLNLSNNHLEGAIPLSLRRFPSSSFSGNHLWFPPPPSPLSPIPSGSGAGCAGTHLSESAILGIVVGVCAVGFVMAAALLVFFCSRRKGRSLASGKLPGGERSPGKAVAGKGEENNRLVFFQGCSFAFDLEDLLRASSEVLGKGTFGTAYKAILEDSTTVVVKAEGGGSGEEGIRATDVGGGGNKARECG
uniref:Putative inactive receptor kinase At4g23740 n=1 Tax=Anthurium amnicola TaxID=1678845 RepID=A0A1D1Y9I1_9ARAE